MKRPQPPPLSHKWTQREVVQYDNEVAQVSLEIVAGNPYESRRISVFSTKSTINQHTDWSFSSVKCVVCYV